MNPIKCISQPLLGRFSNLLIKSTQVKLSDEDISQMRTACQIMQEGIEVDVDQSKILDLTRGKENALYTRNLWFCTAIVMTSKEKAAMLHVAQKPSLIDEAYDELQPNNIFIYRPQNLFSTSDVSGPSSSLFSITQARIQDLLLKIDPKQCKVHNSFYPVKPLKLFLECFINIKKMVKT